MRELLKHLTDSLGDGQEVLLCQVVETKGSTPQKAGALMLIGPDGRQVGTLGGGCVENEVKQNALRRRGQSGAEQHTFILDHDYAWADGLICGGKMVILAEALHGKGPLNYFRAYRELLDAGRGLLEAVMLDPERLGADPQSLGARFLFDSVGKTVAAWPVQELPAAVLERVQPVSQRPRVSSKGGVAILPTLPRIRVVIVGAGHVGQAVAGLAAQADFDVWVVDDRQQYANPERFPMAQRIEVGPIEDALKSLAPIIDEHTYALIVTRGHGHDQEALFHLAPTPAGYVGLIGSHRKIRLIFEELRELGITEAHLDRVTAPIGVPIGSQSVQEIAISVVAQLIARRNLGLSAVPTNDIASRKTRAVEQASAEEPTYQEAIDKRA